MAPKPAKRLRKPDLSPRVASDTSTAAVNASAETMSVESEKSSSISDSSNVEMTEPNVFDENSLIQSRNSQLDISDAFEIASKLRNILAEIVAIRKEKIDLTASDKIKLANLRCESSIMLMLMRRLNRFGQLRCKMLREKSVEKKDLVDEKHIKFLGVQYEVSHLKKQIQNCYNFKSDDEDIDFVDLEYFKQHASSEIYDAEKIGDDPYLLRLAQLQFELAERKRLALEFKEAVRERAKLKSSIEQKKKKLTTLLPNVDEVIKASKPLEEALGVESFFSETRQRLKHLPSPLFVLYCQAMAYAEAFGSDSMVQVSILGDVPESESSVDPTVILAEDDDRDHGSRANDTNDQSGNSDWKPRETSSRVEDSRLTTMTSDESSTSAEVENLKKSGKLLKEHPMMVAIEVGVKDRQEKIEMIFSFLVCLNVVLVKPRLKTSPANSLTTVLTNLFPKDDGSETPNPSNYFMFEKYNVPSFSKFTRHLGFAYQWVQRICGVNFKQLKPGDAVSWHDTVSAHALAQVITMVQDRVKSRIELARQVNSLEKKTIPLPPACLALYPVKLASSILKFQPISPEEYRMGLKIDPANFSEARENAMHFLAVIVKGFQSKEQLHAYIEVMQNYPNSCPVFNLRFSPVASEPLPNWAALLRQLEEEANIKAIEQCPQEHCTDLLTVQLYHLMCCFEVMTDSGRPSERVYPRAFKGRNRNRPFRYKPNTGLFLFN